MIYMKNSRISKYLFCIFIALLVLAGSAEAVTEQTIHIWEDTTGQLGDTDCVAGDCYLTLQAAETAEQRDLVAADTNLVFVIKGSWTSAAATTSFDGFTTDATRDIKITTAGSARHAGTYLATAYRAESSSADVISIKDDYVTIDGLQISQTGANEGIISQNSFTTVTNCIVRGDGEGGSSTWGIYCWTGTNHKVFNCIVYDWGTVGIYCATTIAADDLIYHNTIVDCAIGINGGYTDALSINNIIWSCATPIQGAPASGSGYNATDAGSITYTDCGGGCGTGDILSMSDPFVAVGSDNFLLAASTSPVDAGTDLTATVPEDIIGTSKPVGSDSDIGANERLAAAGGADISFVRRIKEMENK